MTRALAKQNPLPATYAAAKTAIEKCARVDECKDWADKAKALAIYAKQSKDKTLEHNAIRIRARAIKRCGQLIEATPKASGKKAGSDLFTRRNEGKAAGLSERQQKQAVRVARVPDDQFEHQVESDKPPTIETLAQQGVQPHPKATGFDRADMDAGRALWALINSAQRDAKKVKVEQALRGMTVDEIAMTIERGEALVEWLNTTLSALKGVRRDGEKGKGGETKSISETADHQACSAVA
jgi:hypothetical protein